MSSIGLLTGSADRAQRLSEPLKDAGADAVIVTDFAALPDAPGREGLDFSIQLPVTIHPDGHAPVARFGSFLAAGLLARCSAIDPVLAPGATVPHRNPRERASTAAAYQDWQTEVMGLVGIDI